ncbi:trichohyalin-like [Phlebotomus papatasi]|uniref:trichohyalin-like n=1 Tax=Phlebotomus papatasi TaxID=29031 RepID=UPI0024837B95|nr:trichohyalin-like [Phlebotomus papatasi]
MIAGKFSTKSAKILREEIMNRLSRASSSAKSTRSEEKVSNVKKRAVKTARRSSQSDFPRKTRHRFCLLRQNKEPDDFEESIWHLVAEDLPGPSPHTKNQSRAENPLGKSNIHEDRKKLAEECEKRKRRLQEIDKLRSSRKIPEKSLLDTDEDNQLLLLDRAFVAKQEQEEEVKRANRLILATKCHVIRDAQIAEKNEIDRELREEDVRLERIMLEDREKALKEEEERIKKEKVLNNLHALELQKQLEERERARHLEAERIENEAQKMARAQVVLIRDMEEQEKQQHAKSQKLRQELQRANELTEWFRRLEFEQQRIEEMRIQEYMRKRQQREEKLAEERRIAREKRERENDRMLKQQQKVIDAAVERFDIMIRREQELKEREFRQREKQAVIRRKEAEQAILEARHRQQEEVRRLKMQEIEKERADYAKVLEKLHAEEEREKSLDKQRHVERAKYRQEIIEQMKERECLRQKLRNQARDELNALREAEKSRELNIQQVISSKIQQMRSSKIPEKFIRDVERQLKVDSDK